MLAKGTKRQWKYWQKGREATRRKHGRAVRSGYERTAVDEMFDFVDRHAAAFGREEGAFLLLAPIVYEMSVLGIASAGQDGFTVKRW
jgi:hypothetical protein